MPSLNIPLTTHFSPFPFVQDLGKNGRTFFLPGHYKSGLLIIAYMLNITKDEYPTLAQVLIQLPGGT